MRAIVLAVDPPRSFVEHRWDVIGPRGEPQGDDDVVNVVETIVRWRVVGRYEDVELAREVALQTLAEGKLVRLVRVERVSSMIAIESPGLTDPPSGA